MTHRGKVGPKLSGAERGQAPVLLLPSGRRNGPRRLPCPRDLLRGHAVTTSPSGSARGGWRRTSIQVPGESDKTEAAAQRLDRMVERLDALLERVERPGGLFNPEVLREPRDIATQ